MSSIAYILTSSVIAIDAAVLVTKSPTLGVGCPVGKAAVLLYGYNKVIAVPATIGPTAVAASNVVSNPFSSNLSLAFSIVGLENVISIVLGLA